MSAFASGLTNLVSQVLNLTQAQATAAIANGTNATANSYGAIGVNSPPSTSLASQGIGAQEGVNGNTAAKVSMPIPAAMLPIQLQLLTMSAYSYRL